MLHVPFLVIKNWLKEPHISEPPSNGYFIVSQAVGGAFRPVLWIAGAVVAGFVGADFAGIHSDAQGDITGPLSVQFVDTSPHSDRGAAGLNGMVFSGYWSSEESHNSIPTGLVYESIMLMKRLLGA